MKEHAILSVIMLISSYSPAQEIGTTDTEIRKLISRTEPLLDSVTHRPDWLVSRLQMYWHTHSTEVYIDGETFDHVGGSRAPFPTVKFNGTRSNASTYSRPALADIVPYDDDPQGNVTFINKSTGEKEKVHPSKTGCNIANVNRQILGIARDAHAYTPQTATCGMPRWHYP